MPNFQFSSTTDGTGGDCVGGNATITLGDWISKLQATPTVSGGSVTATADNLSLAARKTVTLLDGINPFSAPFSGTFPPK